MTTDIRVGDRFLIEVEVTRETTGGGLFDVRFATGDLGCLGQKELLAGKRLPRAIRVGDRVQHRYPNGSKAVGPVLAINGEYAWVGTGGYGGLFKLRELTLCDEASP